MIRIPRQLAVNGLLAVFLCIGLVACSLVPWQNAKQSETVAADESESSESSPNRIEGDDGSTKSEPEQSQRESALDAQRALNIFLRDQKIIFAQGEFEFETAFQRTTDAQSNVRLGEAIIPSTTRDVSSASFQVRYAFTDDLEGSFRVPLVRTETEFDFAFLEPVEGLTDRDITGLADLQVGLRYQLFRESNAKPDVALSLRYKADTAKSRKGTGDETIGLGATIVRTIDPAVIFLQAEYVFATSDDEVKRGDEYSLLLGTGFSLNDRVGYNARYLIRYTERTSLNGQSIRGTDQYADSLQLGVTVQLGRDIYIEPALAIGLSDDAPDSQFRISLTF